MPRWPAIDPNVTTKFCPACETTKSNSEFYTRKDSRDGLHTYCKVCVNVYMRRRHGDPEVLRKRNARYIARKADPKFIADEKRRSDKFYGSIEGRAKTLLNGARQRDENCTLTLDHIRRGIEAGRCPVTGIEFDLTRNHQIISGRSKSPYSPSMDRINPFKGYTDENVRVVIWQYNMAKGELADYEILFICQQVVARAAA